MTDHSPKSTESEAYGRTRTDESTEPTGVERVISTVRTGTRNGVISILVGAMLLVKGIRSRDEHRFRSLFQVGIGTVLIWLGRRQWHATHQESMWVDDGDSRYSDTSDAHGPTTEHGPAKQPDVDLADDLVHGSRSSSSTESDDDDREHVNVEFTTDSDDQGSKPGLDADTADPRRETDDDQATIDVSETAIADEPGEATGPDPEQSQPTRTEATEPEPTPEEDTSPTDGTGETDAGRVSSQSRTDEQDERTGDAEGRTDGQNEQFGQDETDVEGVDSAEERNERSAADRSGDATDNGENN